MATDKNQRKEEKAQMLECALPVGTVLCSKAGNEYTITGVLGAGGFGITYKAVSQVVLNKKTHYSQMAQFAIKEFFMKGCYRGGSGTDMLCSSNLKGDMERGKEDFKKEADVLIKLNGSSPHIVMVNEQFEANGTCYYVMDYLEGQSLQQYMERRDRRALTEAEALALLLPVARAVALLHSHHLLHLDIKPDNIMLKETLGTDALTPVLIDFGLAKHFDSKGRPTSSLMARGATEGYAPLEQYSQLAYFAPEIDVYALGATLFFLLTGTEPARAHEILSISILAYLQKHLPAGVSQPVREAIEKAMQPIASARMQTVGEFVAALELVAGVSEGDGGASGGAVTVAFEHKKKRFRFKKKHIVMGIVCLVVCIFALCGRAYYVMVNSTEWKAEHGDAEAQYTLGRLSSYDEDYEKAVYWYTKSAEQGNAEAQRELGACYYVGEGVPQDYEKGVYWFTKAAEQGDAGGQYYLGQSYLFDKSVPRDYEKAVYWLTKAVEQNSLDAKALLGDCYFYGLGMPQDKEKAVSLYKQVAQASAYYGCPPRAAIRLGECYELGIGGLSRNDSLAAYWFKRAAMGGDDYAQYTIGIYYKNGKGVPQNDSLAVVWLKKAAEQGNENAREALDRLKPIM